MKNRKFIAEKINVHENIFSQDLDNIISYHIPRAIQEMPTIRHNSWNCSFTDVSKRVINNIPILFGNLTKSKQMKQKIKEESITREKVTEDELAQTALFIYEPGSEILVHEVNSQIDAEEFKKIFEKILSKDLHVGDVIIMPIPVPQKIRYELSLIEKITKIKFEFIHPNPGSKEYNIYSSLIAINNAKKFKLEYMNKDGIKISGAKKIKIKKKTVSEEEDLLKALSEMNQKEIDNTSTAETDKSSSKQPIELNSTSSVIEDQQDETDKPFNKSIEDGIELVESGYGTVSATGYTSTYVQSQNKRKKHNKKRSFSSSNSIQQINTDEHDIDKLLSKIHNFIARVKSKH
ncbi:hypothetical protein [Sporolactobacillus nakayamae]|uniref:Uncharacterized protein n=1 Tax=Sporolactobacillus nakayamae TaxID=269670 RepID=A0A1I2P0G7_9BACL|nr:hypothetical protein [Sporolactobacillus nakayamae]SFG09488.1 hypothetical protein SAMN02982927_00651 [Sporolactobacillus nakayamae]